MTVPVAGNISNSTNSTNSTRPSNATQNITITGPLQCLTTCPPAHRLNSSMMCERCHSNCSSCSRSASQCDTCSPQFFSYRNSCIPACPNATVANMNTKTCSDCPTGCQSCSQPSTCDVCRTNFTMVMSTNPKIATATLQSYLNVSCVPTTFVNETRTQTVIVNRTNTTTGNNATNGTNSTTNATTTTTVNVTVSVPRASCPNGTYFNATLRACTTCQSGCGACNATTCLANCSQNCTDCIVSNTNFTNATTANHKCFACNAVTKHSLFDDRCIDAPCSAPGLFLNKTTKSCDFCPAGCDKCDSQTNCLTCNKTGGYSLVKSTVGTKTINTCTLNCGAYAFSDAQGVCQPCAEGCNFCSNSTTCNQCN
jgi:hypothetical protein